MSVSKDFILFKEVLSHCRPFAGKHDISLCSSFMSIAVLCWIRKLSIYNTNFKHELKIQCVVAPDLLANACCMSANIFENIFFSIDRGPWRP